MMAGLKTRSAGEDKSEEERESARERARGRGSERARLYITNMTYLLSIMDT